jgi:iron complex outermembrane receptor protein
MKGRRCLPLAGIAAAAACICAGPVHAQDAAVKVEKIEVTGSNIKRVDGETGLPVATITRGEIERSGVTTAAELIDRVSAASAGGHSIAQSLGDGSRPGLSAASLRGLGSNDTLVLLNGHRLANFAFNAVGGGTVNLNQIPLAAVARVEILKDGASAIYGTDAIGGVINFILRKDYEGAEVSASGSATSRGGGGTDRYTATLGFGDVNRGGFNVLALVDYQKDKPLGASQRAFASTGIRPDLAVALVSGNTYPANFNVGRNFYNLTAAQGCLPAAGSYRVDANGAPAPINSCVYDFSSVLQIYPAAERKSAFLRGAWQLNSEHQAFLEYHLARNQFTLAASETPVIGGDSPILYPAGGPFYPASFTLADGTVIHPAGDLRIRGRLKAAGLRTDRVDSDEQRLLAGLQGVLRGWDYDAAWSRATSKASDNYIDGYVRESAIRAAIATGLVDVFSVAPLTPQAQAMIDAAKIREKIRDSDSSVTAIGARASREIAQLRSGAMALAVGFDHRKEEIEERPQEVLYTGDILGGGGSLPPTTQASRTTDSAFAELGVPLVRNVEAQLAVRYDRFSDFGSTTNPKVALRWTPRKDLLVRASYGTGFRAPTLSDLFLPPANSFDSGPPDPARCPGGNPTGPYVDPDVECIDGEFRVRVGGSPAAKPEKSRQWSAGAIFEPLAGDSVGVDFWTIRRRSSLQLVSRDAVFNVFAASDPVTAGGRIVRQPRLADGSCAGDADGLPTPAGTPCAIDYVLALIENLGNYDTSGLDLSATFRLKHPRLGTFTLHGEGTYFLRYHYQLTPGGEYHDNVGLASTDNGAISRWRHTVMAEWRRGPWGASLGHNFVLGYRDEDREGAPPRRVASFETWDLQGTWEGWKGLKLAAGVRNLFDRDPPASRQANTFQVGYDARYYDPRGRILYASLRYAFR